MRRPSNSRSLANSEKVPDLDSPSLPDKNYQVTFKSCIMIYKIYFYYVYLINLIKKCTKILLSWMYYIAKVFRGIFVLKLVNIPFIKLDHCNQYIVA